MPLTLYAPDPADGPWMAAPDNGETKVIDVPPGTAARWLAAMGGHPAGRFEGGWNAEKGIIEVGDYLGPVLDA